MATVKYSGPVASFHCPTEATIRSLKVHFSPKQLGEGTPSPENVREIVGWDRVEVKQNGRNLFDASNVIYISSDAWCNTTTHKITASNGDKTLYVPCLPNSVYTISKTIGDVLAGGYTTDAPATGVDLYSYYRDNHARKITITTGDDAKYIAIWFYDKSKTTDKTMTPEDVYRTIQIEYGSTANLIEPYQGSTTNYEFGVLGKNKLDEQKYADITNYPNQGDYGYKYTDPIILAPNTTYKFSFTPTVNYETKRYWAVKAYTDAYEDINDSGTVKYLVKETYSANYEITTGAKGAIRFAVYGGQTTLDEIWDRTTVQMELGSTATTYEPYNPNKTVYGGWVDLVSGEVCEEWKTIDIGTLTWNSDTSKAHLYTANVPSDSKANSSNNLCICDMYNFLVTSLGTIRTKSDKTIIYGRNGYRGIYLFDDEIEQPSDMNAKLNNVIIAYPLDVPTTYHLAPIQLQTFLGQNNVWSNADYVEVEYDLHETQNILARKQFIVANQPHVETLAAAPLQGFETDMAAPIKSAIVRFSPVQEGEGNPSPENIRPISGWTGLTAYHSGENLYVPNPDNKGYINVSGAIKVDTTSTYTDLIPVTAGETYSFKCTTVSVPEGTTNRRLHGYDSNGNWVLQITNRTTAAATVEDVSIAVTIPSGVSYIRASFRNQDTNVRVAKENVIGVNWQTEAGTIYGGYVDLASGEVVAEWASIDMGSLSFTAGNKYSGRDLFHTILPVKPPETDDDAYNGLSPIFNSVSYNASWAIPWRVGRNPLNNRTTFIIPNDMCETAEDFRTAMAGNIFVYELAEPIHYSLTPTQLKSFRGANSVWSTANGNIELSYWTH